MKKLQAFIERFYSWDGNVLLITLFVVLSLFQLWFEAQSLELTSFAQHIVGQATLDKIDISKRVALYHQSLFLIGGLLLALYPILLVLKQKLVHGRILFRYLKYIGFAGLCFLFFKLMKVTETPLVDFAWIWVACLLVYFLLSFKASYSFADHHLFFWLTSIAVAMAFFGRELINIGGATNPVPQFQWVFLWFFILVNGAYAFLSKLLKSDNCKWVSALRPLFFLPILSAVSDELYLTLNQRGINFLSANEYYGVFSLLLVTACYLIYLKTNGQSKGNLYRENVVFVFPILIIGITTLAFYEPFITQPESMFELANPANGIMRTWDFGEIPLMEALSSHLLSEQFFPFLYTLVNGYSGGLEFFIYDFIHEVVFILILYYFLRNVLNNGYAAFLAVLVFPFYDTLVPASFSFCLVTILLLYKLYQHYNGKTIIALIVWSIFLIGWKIDVGYANLIALGILLAGYGIWQGRAKVAYDFIKTGLVIIVVLGLGMWLVTLSQDIDLLVNMKKALSYFTADQAHGLSQITYEYGALFYYHYFVFPVLVLVLLIGMVLWLAKAGSIRNRELLLTTAVIYLALYYFANASRGIVRHGFAEHTDAFISSFFFLIIGLSGYFWFRKTRYPALLGFFALTIFTIQIFSYPDSKGQHSIYKNFNEAFINPVEINEQEKAYDRVKKNTKFAQENYSKFVQFMDKHFPEKATFIDLSNTPMLYFYSKRPVPSYFNQYMQNTVTPFLQKKNLEYLKQFDVPVVVFAHHPKNWFDKTDGVPNPLRYFFIANHIYRQYRPYDVINGYYIWVRKGIKDFGVTTQVDTQLVNRSKTYDLKQYPYVAGNYGEFPGLDTIESWDQEDLSKNNRLDLPKNFRPYLNYLSISVENGGGSAFQGGVYYQEGKDTLGTFHFQVADEPGKKQYLIPLSVQYNWTAKEADYLKFQLQDGSQVNKMHLLRDPYFEEKALNTDQNN